MPDDYDVRAVFVLPVRAARETEEIMNPEARNS
jgi:hypothetical protein